MVSNQDKKSGLMSHAIARLYKQCLEEQNKPVDEPSVRTVGVNTITTVRQGFALRKNFRDQWFMTNSSEVVRYETATKTGKDVTVQGYAFFKQVPAFTEPCLSTEANIYSANMEDLNKGELQHDASSTLMCKVAAVETGQEGVLMIPQHELKKTTTYAVVMGAFQVAAALRNSSHTFGKCDIDTFLFRRDHRQREIKPLSKKRSHRLVGSVAITSFCNHARQFLACCLSVNFCSMFFSSSSGRMGCSVKPSVAGST
uniref:Uncharacterized protein n=1 Tax=Anopheles merus TaxID=30066 RepID=A0A182V9F2_ANOME